MSAASIILSDNLSPQNVTLNLLALIFIIEADNLFASLVFSRKQLEKAENLVERAKKNNVFVKISVVKRDSLIISLFMFLACFYIRVLLKYLSPTACGISFALTATFILLIPHLMMILKFLGVLIYSKEPKKWTRAVLSYLWMYIGAYLMAIMYCVSRFTVAADLFEKIPPVPLIVSSICSICVVARPRQIIEESYKYSRKDPIINLILAAAWFAVQFWCTRRLLVVTGLL